MIKTYPDPILRTVCEKIPKDKISDCKNFTNAMKKVILDFKALGLAACQIGIPFCIVGIKPSGLKEPYFMINPEIIDCSGTMIGPEACLSFPNVLVNIKRSSYIKVKYLNTKGEEKIEEYMGQEAVIIQHEIDHLNGITLVQSAPKAMRGQIMRKLKIGSRKMAKYMKSQKRLKLIGKELAKSDTQIEENKEISDSDKNPL